MLNEFTRTEILLGEQAMERLRSSTVAVFGIGGVGSFVVEALARCGVGKLILFDNDVISITNINRQLIATRKTISRKKIDVMKERILDINQSAIVEVNDCFFIPENSSNYDFSKYNYIVDAVDTVTAKLELVMRAKEKDIPIISSMGAGNKLDPTKFEIADIYKTSVCPLAKVMRHELRQRGVEKLKVVYSKEVPLKPINSDNDILQQINKRITPGSISFVPSVAGLIIASEVVKDIISK